MKFLKNRVFRFFSIIIFFAVCTLIFTYPSVHFLNTKLIGDGGDNTEYFSYAMQVKNNLALKKNPFSHSYTYYYPVGFNLNTGSDAKLFILLVGYFSMYFNEILMFNIFTLLFIALNGICSYIFFRLFTKSDYVGVICGIIFGFSSYAITRAIAYSNIMQIYGYPLFFTSLLLVYRNKTISFSTCLLFISSILLISLSNLQATYLLFNSLLISALFTLIIYKRQTLPVLKLISNNWKHILLGIIVLVIGFVCIYKDHIYALLKLLDFASAGRDVRFITLPLFKALYTYVFPSIYSRTILAEVLYMKIPGLHNIISPINQIDLIHYLGFIEIILFIFSIPYVIKTKQRYLLFLLTIFLLFSLSDYKENVFTIPFVAIRNCFPFSIISESHRYHIIFSFLFTLVIAMWLKTFNVNKFYYILIIILLLGERATLNFHLFMPLFDKYQEVASHTDTKAVLDLPIYINTYHYPSSYNLLPYAYQKPILTGYVIWLAYSENPTSFIEKNNQLTQFSCDRDPSLGISYESSQNILKRLKSYSINTIVVHKDLLKSSCKEVSQNIQDFISFNTFQEQLFLKKIYENDAAIVYTIH